MFHTIGLSQDAERLYRLLLIEGTMTPADAARRLRFDAGSLDELVTELAQVGLVVADEDGNLKSLDPQRPVERALSARRRELDDAQQELAALVAEYRQMGADDSNRLVHVVRGAADVSLVMREFVVTSTTQLCNINTPPYIAPVNRAVSIQNEHDTLERGVDVRVLYSAGAMAVPGRMESIQRDVTRGEQARMIESVPLKMLIIDARRALVPVTVAGPDALISALVVDALPLVSALQSLFDHLWHQATPLYDDSYKSVNEPAEGDRELLAVLTTGLKDEAAARSLGVSVRTYRRRMATLFERLDVDSRFAAGVAASKRGWV